MSQGTDRQRYVCDCSCNICCTGFMRETYYHCANSPACVSRRVTLEQHERDQDALANDVARRVFRTFGFG